MHRDLLAYQLQLLLSLERGAPLNENMVTIMFSTLAKLCNYCDAAVGIHVFTNPSLREFHTLLYGSSPRSRDCYHRGLVHRHDLAESLSLKKLLSCGPSDWTQMPTYREIAWPEDGELERLLNPDGLVQAGKPASTVGRLFEGLKAQMPEEFPESFDIENGTVLTIPLGTGEYRRLGCFLLWIEPGSSFNLDRQETERLTTFRKEMERLIIKVFCNFYSMEPATYLPSYYQTGRKNVALICAEIRGFDRVSEIINRRIGRDLTQEQAADCLTRLINGFSETVSQAVEKYDGRIDQFWGSGTLALFGEHMIDPDKNPHIPCMKAVTAAAELVENFREVMNRWLAEEFRIDKFRESFSEHIFLDASVAVDYGDVMLDYVGSSKHRVYMALGDHVEFAKQLVSLSGRPQSNFQNQPYLFPQVPTFQRNDLLSEESVSNEAPILISQTAHSWSRHILKDLKGSQVDAVHRPRVVHLKGMPTPYVIYEIVPENVERTTR